MFHLSSETNSKKYDIIIVGGGIVGTASAREILLRHPTWKIAVVEKEDILAAHQTGHNSGVVHAGIYYLPGSLKAKLCVEGMHLSYKYFDTKNIPYKKNGKLIVATSQEEIPRLNVSLTHFSRLNKSYILKFEPICDFLQALHERAIKNGVPDLQMVDGNKITDFEPYCKGLRALWSPHTGIVDWALVTRHYAEDVQKSGGDIFLNYEVSDFSECKEDSEYPVVIKAKGSKTTLQTKYVLTCAGLQSDKIAELTGCPRSPRIVPIRGEYLLLRPEKQHMVRGNIYPVPDPSLPFLGVGSMQFI